MKILTNDPSMTAWGWAVIELSNNQASIIDHGCIKTQPEHKKKRIRKSDDRTRRLGEICRILITVHEKHNLDFVLCEAPHGSQNASAAIMIGAVAGLVVSFGACYNLPVEWYSEGDAKKFLSGKRSLTKADTIDLIKKEYGTDWIQKVKYKDEAVADALAVFHIARNQSPVLIYAANQKLSITRTK